MTLFYRYLFFQPGFTINYLHTSYYCESMIELILIFTFTWKVFFFFLEISKTVFNFHIHIFVVGTKQNQQ